MAMGWGAIASIVSDVADSALSEIASRQKAKKAFKRQKMIMKNMITWRVKDLQRAGLNPMLATGAGVGGTSAMVQQAGSGGEGEGPGAFEVSSALDTLMRSKKLQPEIENIEANTGVSNRQSDNIIADTEKKNEERINTEVDTEVKSGLLELNNARRQNELAQAEAASASAQNMHIRSRVMELGIPGLMNQFGVDASKAGEILNWINNISHTAKGVTDVINPFVGGHNHPSSPRVRGFE